MQKLYLKKSQENHMYVQYNFKKYFLSTYVCVIRFQNVVTNPIIFP